MKIDWGTYMKKQLLVLPLLAILLSGCGVTNNSSSDASASSSKESSYSTSGSIEPLPTNVDARHRNYYQLLVYSFADSNNDGWGENKLRSRFQFK